MIKDLLILTLENEQKSSWAWASGTPPWFLARHWWWTGEWTLAFLVFSTGAAGYAAAGSRAPRDSGTRGKALFIHSVSHSACQCYGSSWKGYCLTRNTMCKFTYGKKPFERLLILTPKWNRCLRIDAFELRYCRRLFRVPWTARRSNHSILKEANPEYSLEGLMTEAEAPILWPLDVKNWLIGKDPDAGKDWGQEKRVTEDEITGWHHQLNGHKSEQTPGDSEGQRSLACYSSWDHKESDMT